MGRTWVAFQVYGAWTAAVFTRVLRPKRWLGLLWLVAGLSVVIVGAGNAPAGAAWLAAGSLVLLIWAKVAAIPLLLHGKLPDGRTLDDWRAEKWWRRRIELQQAAQREQLRRLDEHHRWAVQMRRKADPR
jgi:hypothetical protein